MRFRLLLLLTALMIGCPLFAEQRIAVVDLDKIFREYYKSKIAEQFIRQQSEAFRAYAGQLQGQLAALRSEERRLGTDALNPALSAADKEKTEKLAADVSAKVKAKEAEIKLYVAERSREMRALESRRRNEIVTDIRAEIRRRATAEGYAFVFDCSGKTLNDQPSLLHFPEANDLTPAIIRELNRSAAKPKSESK